MARVVLILGGARSGKSAFALARASQVPGAKTFIATAEAYDDEMEERIRKHKSERGSAWQTLEEPLHLHAALAAATARSPVVLVDCLTLWLSNLLCREMDIEGAEEKLLDALRAVGVGSEVLLVSNEVGMGIVPDNAMARRFRDIAGRLNQRVAQIADEVFLVAAGIPVKIK